MATRRCAQLYLDNRPDFARRLRTELREALADAPMDSLLPQNAAVSMAAR